MTLGLRLSLSPVVIKDEIFTLVSFQDRERESDLLYEMMKLLLRKMDPSTGLSLTCAAPPLLVAFIRTSHLTMSMLLMQFIILFRSFLCVAAFFSHSLPTEMYDFLNMCMSQLPCGSLCI